MDGPKPPDEVMGAPPGATCATHDHRPAAVTCPHCRRAACAFCWHASLGRCDMCLRQDPASAAPPVPWEAPDTPPIARWVRTLATAFAPAATAPAFARTPIGPALRFLLATAVPLSLLVGLVPHTRTLLFSGAGQVRLVGDPDAIAIGLDVVRAMLTQLTVHGVQLLAFLLPYRSLSAAYGGADRAPFAVRAALYRAWLLPVGGLVQFAVLALSPTVAEPPGVPAWALGIVLTAQLGAMVLFTLSMIYAARLASGLSTLWAVVAVAVALILAAIGGGAAESAAQWLLPPAPTTGA